jgi:hypothetical protein
MEIRRAEWRAGRLVPVHLRLLIHRGDSSFQEKSGVFSKKELIVWLELLSCPARGSGSVSLLANGGISVARISLTAVAGKPFLQHSFRRSSSSSGSFSSECFYTMLTNQITTDLLKEAP